MAERRARNDPATSDGLNAGVTPGRADHQHPERDDRYRQLFSIR
jgi:hypothetical protein